MGGAAPEQAIGKRAAHALMEEHEEQGGAGALVGEPLRVTTADALQQAVGLQLVEVVRKLGEPVTFGSEGEARKNLFMDIAGTPAQDLVGAAVQQHLHQVDHAGIVAHQVVRVAIEATGVQWKPVYYALEEGREILLVNAAHVKRCRDARPTLPTACGWRSCWWPDRCGRASFCRSRFATYATSSATARA